MTDVHDLSELARFSEQTLRCPHVLILKVLRESQGFAVTVEDREVEPARAEMARLDGIHLCPEGAATMVAYGKALKRGLIAAGDRAVLFNCASGLKYAMPPVAARLDRHQPIDYAAILGAPLTA